MGRRLPLWVWVQEGTASAVEALLSVAGEHGEQIDVDTLVALQRCHNETASRQEIECKLHQHLGNQEFGKLQAAASTRRLFQELHEAYDDQRNVCLDIIHDTLAKGGNANSQEEEGNDFDEN